MVDVEVLESESVELTDKPEYMVWHTWCSVCNDGVMPEFALCGHKFHGVMGPLFDPDSGESCLVCTELLFKHEQEVHGVWR